MTKKELIKAIKSVKEVSVCAHIHKDICFYVKVVKSDLIRQFHRETEDFDAKKEYHAQIVQEGTALIIG